MIRILVLGILFFTISNSFSQSNNPMRIEVADNNLIETISIPLESKDFLILKHNKKRGPKGEHWVLSIYNPIFFKTGNKDIYLPREFILFNYKLISDSIVYLSFAENNGNNSSLMIYQLNLNTNYLGHAYIKGSKRARLINIEYLENKIFIIGERMEGIQEQLKGVSLPNNIKIIAPIFPQYTNVIASYSNLSSNKTIIMTKIFRGSDKGLYYNELNGYNNTFIKNQIFDADNVNLVDGSLVESKGDALLFMGTFNYDKSRQGANENVERVGTFFAKIREGQFSFFKTNNFSEFKNVFSTLNYKDQIRAKQNLEKGKDVDLRFKLLIHKEAIKQHGLYVLTFETYFPEYHYENNFDSRGYMYQMQVFDGYRTNNCIVAAFNINGRLLWDNYMHIEDIVSYQLQENVLVFGENDSSIVLAYYSDGKIKSKVVKGNKVVYKKSEDRIETLPNETIISEKYGRIEHWYDNYFILSGYQTIIGSNSKKRKVYYFNMISFE